MHTVTQYPLWMRLAALLTISALLGVVIQISKANEPVEVKKEETPVPLLSPEEVTSFGFAVSGIVEAANSVTVRALANGTVREKFAKEGSTVYEGEVLLRQEIPLLSERVTLQGAQNGLGSLMQEAAVIGRRAEKESAWVQHEAASTSASLVAERSTVGIESATALLATQIYGSVTSLVAALDFIDANKPHFDGATLTAFRKTVDALYGSNRTYLSGSVHYNFHSSNDILNFLDTVTENNLYPDTTTLVEIATLVDGELDATKRILVSGEEEFFDRQAVPQYGELYTAYLTYRGSVIEAQANLRIALGGARGATVGGELGVLGAQTEDKLRVVGYITASTIAENAASIAAQADAVSGAAMNILAGEESLGLPKAPFTGVVDEVFVKVGEFVPAGTPLMTVVGSGAKEIKVSVPYTMLPYLKEGAEFVVAEKTVGCVARFSQTAMNGNVTVVIELQSSDYLPGMTLRGEIQCAPIAEGALALPRAYVHFDNAGPFVEVESGKWVRVIILHDTGKTFIVKPEMEVSEKIRKAVGITL